MEIECSEVYCVNQNDGKCTRESIELTTPVDLLAREGYIEGDLHCVNFKFPKATQPWRK